MIAQQLEPSTAWAANWPPGACRNDAAAVFVTMASHESVPRERRREGLWESHRPATTLSGATNAPGRDHFCGRKVGFAV